jgi:hypothetical protein
VRKLTITVEEGTAPNDIRISAEYDPVYKEGEEPQTAAEQFGSKLLTLLQEVADGKHRLEEEDEQT